MTNSHMHTHSPTVTKWFFHSNLCLHPLHHQPDLRFYSHTHVSGDLEWNTHTHTHLCGISDSERLLKKNVLFLFRDTAWEVQSGERNGSCSAALLDISYITLIYQCNFSPPSLLKLCIHTPRQRLEPTPLHAALVIAHFLLYPIKWSQRILFQSVCYKKHKNVAGMCGLQVLLRFR